MLKGIAMTTTTSRPKPLRGRLSPRDLRWWVALFVVLVGSFAVLLYMGAQINQAKPPIPDRVVDTSGRVIVTGDDIISGQKIWQSIGGQQIGSVWGHGAYVAPDWTADWLHREATFLLEQYAGPGGYESLDPERRAALEARLKLAMRTNTYDAATGTITLDPLRAQSFEENAAYYANMFAEGHENYAIPSGTLSDPALDDRCRASSGGPAGPHPPMLRTPMRPTP